MRKWILVWCAAALVVVASGCRTPAQAGKLSASAAPAELVQTPALSEVTRHLYRWYLDENDVERVANKRELVFWVRRVNVKLDSGDQSVFAEICLPQLGITINLKKADYMIEETKTPVQSRTFRIKNVGRGPLPASPPQDRQVVRVPMQEMKDFLFRTRSQPDYPSAALLERMRHVLRQEIGKEGSGLTNAPTGEQTAYLAPLSPVGNDAWVFWENRKMLIRFESDIDLSNPAVWKHETMRVQVYDTYSQMVISNEEAAASNRFMTRNQIGRALYNCVVLGQRVAVTPPPASGQ